MKYDGKTVLAKPDANTFDIIEALVKISPTGVKQVKPYYNDLINFTGDAKLDALLVSNFIRKNITYKADGYDKQNIQLPGRLLKGTKLGDCKSFSLLFYSLMTAAGHKAGYRFASYRKNKIPTHFILNARLQMHGQLIIMTLPQVNHIPHVYQWIFHISPLVQRRVKLHTMQYDGHIRADSGTQSHCRRPLRVHMFHSNPLE